MRRPSGEWICKSSFNESLVWWREVFLCRIRIQGFRLWLYIHPYVAIDKWICRKKLQTATGSLASNYFAVPLNHVDPFLTSSNRMRKRRKKKKLQKAFFRVEKLVYSNDYLHSIIFILRPTDLHKNSNKTLFLSAFFFRKQVAKMTFHLSCLRRCLIRAMSRPIMAPWLDDEAFWHQRLLRHCLGIRQVHVYTQIILGRRESVQCSHGKQFATLKFLNSLSGKASSEQRT